jgi:hypothetical protein
MVLKNDDDDDDNNDTKSIIFDTEIQDQGWTIIFTQKLQGASLKWLQEGNVINV